MAVNKDRGISDHKKYDAMATETLEEILRLDADAPEEQALDTETLLHILEVLTSRKNTQSTESAAQVAFESFKKNYLSETSEDTVVSEQDITLKKPLHWFRWPAVAAAILAVILLGSMTAKAFGYDIWKAVVQWTQETFYLGDGSQADDELDVQGNLKYASLQELLTSAGVEQALVPTWIPEGYEVSEITIQQTPVQDVYGTIYTNGDDSIIITIRNYLEGSPEYVEQSDKLLETYELFGVTYYLLNNNNRAQVVWIKDTFECYISGDVTIEELKMMIDSIEKG